MALQPGQTLSHYRIVEQIGAGGMGAVYRARDEKLRRDVALKVLRSELVRDPESRLRFLREARAAAAVTHPNIATIHEVDEAGGTLFLAMELVEGRTLRDHVSEGAMPLAEAIRYGAEIAEGLARAHQSGVIHRDIKPENVIVTREGHPKILDFGLAKVLETQQEQDLSQLSEAETAAAQMTREGALLGTWAYMSPEQARGEAVDARSDLFSFGIMLYEMATGRRPFAWKSPADTLASILTKPATPPSRVNPKVTPDLEEVLDRCLEKEADKRYQRTDELVADLRGLREATSAELSLYRLSRAVRRSWPLAVALVAALAIAAVVVLNWERLFGPGPDPGTVLVLPLEVRGEEQGADYLGQVFAEWLAANLIEAENLKILPVPSAGELASGMQNRSRAAVEAGAGRLLIGSLTREGEVVRASLSLVDAADNRILWGTDEEADRRDLKFLAPKLALEVTTELGGVTRNLYDLPTNITQNPDLVRSSLYLELLAEARRYGHSTDKALALAEAFPDEPDALLVAVIVFMNEGYFEKSEEAWRKIDELLADVARLEPENPWEDFYRAWRRGELEGDRPAEIKAYTRILERNDLTASLRSLILAYRAHANSGLDRDAADRDFAEAVRLGSPSYEVNRNYAMFLFEAGRREEAVVQIRLAAEIDPAGPAVQWILAEFLFFTDRWDEAVPVYGRICEDGKRQEPCAKHAYSLYRAGRLEEARVAAAVAEDLEDQPDGTWFLANCWAGLGDDAAAIRVLRRWVDVAPPQYPLRANSDLTPLRGDPEFEAMAAEQWSKLAARHGEKCAAEPSQVVCAVHAVDLCLLGRADEALAAAAKAASLEESGWGFQMLAWYHGCARNRDEVIRYLKRCRELGGCGSYLGDHEDYTWISGDQEFEALFTEPAGDEGQVFGD